jgi:hypothetical protein
MRSSLLAIVLAAVAGLTTTASAQETDPEAEDTARARTLFSEGVALAAEEEFADAADRFRAAYAIHPTPAIAYNLAAALVKLDLLLEASELVRSVTNDPESSPQVRQLAEALRPQIDERMARLTVRVDGDIGSARVNVDEREMRNQELGVPFPMDPGDHVVAAVRNGEVLEQQPVTLEVAGSAEVTLAASTWPPEEEEIVDVPPPEPGPAFYETWWFWTIVGLAVVGGTVAVILAASGTEDPVAGNATPGVVTF